MGDKKNLKLLYTVKDIPIENLLHSDQFAYEKEGHGGKPVWDWPIFKFYSLYYQGEKEKAQKQYVDWYLDQYKSYSNLSSSKGGMKGGSLDRLIKNEMKSQRDGALNNAILKRVKQRFELYKSIKSKEYTPNLFDPVKVFEVGKNKFKLFGGHHRVACLAILNYDIVPGVFVYRNRFSYFIFRIKRKLNLLKY